MTFYLCDGCNMIWEVDDNGESPEGFFPPIYAEDVFTVLSEIKLPDDHPIMSLRNAGLKKLEEQKKILNEKKLIQAERRKQEAIEKAKKLLDENRLIQAEKRKQRAVEKAKRLLQEYGEI